MKTSTKIAISSLLLGALFIISNIPPGPVYGEVDCLACHKALSEEKVVHAALQMGCINCHGAIDAAEVPHKKTNKIAKGLSSEQPELCYGCHDKSKFTNKTVHAAIGMGCTGCHNPHSSKNAKLLISEIPGLCFNCHDKAEFSRKNVHAPLKEGLCLQCHSVIHASKNPALLGKKVNTLCIGCHTAIPKSLHAVRGFRSEGHPLQGKKDPRRPDKAFSCASCHNPHSSDSPRLFRYQASDAFALCKYCHEQY